MSDMIKIVQTRHARLFELIRQQNQARRTVTKLHDLKVRRLSTNEAAQLQRAAARSLQAGPVARLPETLGLRKTPLH